MDYASLTIQIQQYTKRTDPFFIGQIPDFINQGIARIYSEAKSIGFQKIQGENGALVFVQGQPFIDKPVDWRETISFQYTIPGANPFATFLLPRTYEFCKTYSPNTATQGKPQFYADYSMPQVNAARAQFFIAPTPDAPYPYQLMYLSLPEFDVNNPENFLTDKYPQLLLYACTLEAMLSLKDDERIQVFESLYNRALQDINKDTTARYTDRISKRDKD